MGGNINSNILICKVIVFVIIILDLGQPTGLVGPGANFQNGAPFMVLISVKITVIIHTKKVLFKSNSSCLGLVGAPL